MGMCRAPSAWPACHSSSSRTSSRKSPSLRSWTSTVGTPAPKCMLRRYPKRDSGRIATGCGPVTGQVRGRPTPVSASGPAPQLHQFRLAFRHVVAQLCGDLVEEAVGIVGGEPEHPGDRAVLQLLGDEREDLLALGEPLQAGVELLAAAGALLGGPGAGGPLLGQPAQLVRVATGVRGVDPGDELLA